MLSYSYILTYKTPVMKSLTCKYARNVYKDNQGRYYFEKVICNFIFYLSI